MQLEMHATTISHIFSDASLSLSKPFLDFFEENTK